MATAVENVQLCPPCHHPLGAHNVLRIPGTLYMHVLGKDIVLGVLTVPAYIIQNTHACLQVADDFQCTQYTQSTPVFIGIHWVPSRIQRLVSNPDLWQIRGDTGQQLTPGPATGKWLGQRQFKIYMVQGTATAR